MEMLIAASAAPPPDERPIEIVESKGQGHPDSICDALAEELSLALSRAYLERAGAILHHEGRRRPLLRGARLEEAAFAAAPEAVLAATLDV